MGRKAKSEEKKMQEFTSSILLSEEMYRPLSDISECFGIPMAGLVRTAIAIATPILMETYARLSKYSIQLQGIAAALPIRLNEESAKEVTKMFNDIQDRIAYRNAVTNKAITELRDKTKKKEEEEAKGLAEEHEKEQVAIEASLPKDPPLFNDDGCINEEVASSKETPTPKKEVIQKEKSPTIDDDDILSLLSFDVK